MARKRNKNNEAYFRSLLANTWDYTQYEDMLTEIALARFHWEGLPDTCDERYLERALLFQGRALYFEDEVVGALTLKTTLTGKFDVYGIPVIREAYGENGYTTKRTKDNSVIIWNNLGHRPTFPIITNFAMRLYDLDRTIDVNARAQKTPMLLLAEESERLSLENMYMKYDGNQPVIFAPKSNTMKDIKDIFTVLKTDAPYVSDKIYQLKVNIWNEAMSALGIANLAMQKKERMVSSEINNLMGGTLAQRYSLIEARQRSADEINKMFGTDITVNYRDGDIDTEGQESSLIDLVSDESVETESEVNNE